MGAHDKPTILPVEKSMSICVTEAAHSSIMGALQTIPLSKKPYALEICWPCDLEIDRETSILSNDANPSKERSCWSRMETVHKYRVNFTAQRLMLNACELHQFCHECAGMH